jgi:hypothetical protein
MAEKPHTIRVRHERWEAIEKKAWQLSSQAQRVIKPTDVADALLFTGIKSITIEDIEHAKRSRG